MALWMVPICWRGDSNIRSKRPLYSLVRYCSVFIPIIISIRGTRSLLGEIASWHIHLIVDPFFIVIGFWNTRTGLLPGITVKASMWESLRSIAANWAGEQECRWKLFGQITGQFPTRGAIVRRKRVFRVAVVRASMASVVQCRGWSLW